MKWMRIAVVFAAAFFIAAPAQPEVAVPPLRARVTDLTGTLDPSQQVSLEQHLAAFEAAQGSQIAVLMVPTTQPEPIGQYAIRVAEQWKLGRRGQDDGALLLVAKADHAVRIEVGYGLEGALNDAVSKRIVSEVIIPRFKQGDFSGGIQAGVDEMMAVVKGEKLPVTDQRFPGRGSSRRSGGGSSALSSGLVIAVLASGIVGAMLKSLFGPLPGAAIAGLGAGAVAWLIAVPVAFIFAIALVAFCFTLFSGSGGGFIGGGYGVGGFGAGGFGGGGGNDSFGGGGGSFGGGGASGSW